MEPFDIRIRAAGGLLPRLPRHRCLTMALPAPNSDTPTPNL